MKKIWIATLAAGFAGWMLHSSSCPPTPSSSGGQAPSPVPERVTDGRTGEAPVLHWMTNDNVVQGSQRNVFAFVEKRAPVVVRREVPTPILPTPTPAAIIEQQRPAAPEFTYRCIGTFGPSWRRFAVFTGADEIVNAQIGDAIGRSAFVLREIGIEAVTVESNAMTRRVEIGRP